MLDPDHTYTKPKGEKKKGGKQSPFITHGDEMKNLIHNMKARCNGELCDAISMFTLTALCIGVMAHSIAQL